MTQTNAEIIHACKLVDYLERHGFDARIAANGTDVEAFETVYSEDGTVWTGWTPIAPTLDDVRAWLGY